MDLLITDGEMSFLLVGYIGLLLLGIVLLLAILFFLKMMEEVEGEGYDAFSAVCLAELHHLPY